MLLSLCSWCAFSMSEGNLYVLTVKMFNNYKNCELHFDFLQSDADFIIHKFSNKRNFFFLPFLLFENELSYCRCILIICSTAWRFTPNILAISQLSRSFLCRSIILLFASIESIYLFIVKSRYLFIYFCKI